MQTVELPEDVEASYEDGTLTVENSETLTRKMDNARVEVETFDDRIEFRPLDDKRDVESIAKTYASHAENMIQGLEEDYVYELKGVYAHFPMNIKKEGDEVLLENFMGEREPRRIEIMDGVQVEVKGEDLEVRGPDKEKVGQTAARIEQACKKGDRDPRTFQDGVYITGEPE